MFYLLFILVSCEFFFPEYCETQKCYNCTEVNRNPLNCDACKNMWGPVNDCGYCKKGFDKNHDCNICAGHLKGDECNICEPPHTDKRNCGIPSGYYEKCLNFIRRMTNDDDDEEEELKKFCVEEDSEGNYLFIQNYVTLATSIGKAFSVKYQFSQVLMVVILSVTFLFA